MYEYEVTPELLVLAILTELQAISESTDQEDIKRRQARIQSYTQALRVHHE